MSSCCEVNLSIDSKVLEIKNKVLLMGNPNVGKSVIFSALTGSYVMSSNYAGTTVTYTKAKMKIDDQEYQLIDVPGTYSLNPTSPAEQVAVSFMKSDAKAVVCVLDATNLTRNLNLALEVQSRGVPVIFALNLIDVAKRKGIEIDAKLLEKELGAPVISTVAVKGEGFDELKKAILKIENGQSEVFDLTQEELWEKSAEIAERCTTSSKTSLKFIDKLGEKMVKPMPGIPIAVLVMILSLAFIVGLGKTLRVLVFIPLVDETIVTFFANLIGSFGLNQTLENILIGEYGIFKIGFEWPLSLILPYVSLFYVVFTFLEDCGFLPRIAVLFDNIMRKMGVQGGSLISLVMGYGCAVPAIIGTRNATTRKERIIISAMVCFAVPCISQIGALVSLLGGKPLLLIGIFAVSFIVIAIVGFITGKLLEGKIDPIIIEIPNLLLPEKKSYLKKLSVRLKSFLIEAEGPMLIAIVIASIGIESGVMDYIATACEPFVSAILGLPKEAISGLLLGIIRREMTVFALAGMQLSNLQLFVGSVVSLLYLPCLSVFGVIAKEFNAKVAFFIGVGTFTSAIALGSLINFVGQLFI